MAAVTNENKRIANTALKFEERNLATDDKNETVVGAKDVKHQNKGKLCNAIQKTTTKTQFEGGQVVCVDYKVATNDDSHAGIAGGEKTHTYLFPAWATEGSPTVRTEGDVPTRNEDKTKQNNGNSEGLVCDPAEAERLKKLAEERLKRCSLKELEIAKCGHGRKITDARILEVIASSGKPETAFIKAKRTNAVEPGDAVCYLGDEHTEWVISRKKGGGLEEKKDKRNGDELTLEAEWFSDTEPESELELENAEDNEKVDKFAEKSIDKAAKNAAHRDSAKEIYDDSKARRAANPTEQGSVVKAQQAWKDGGGEAREKAAAEKAATYDKNTRKEIKKARKMIAQAIELKDFAKCFFARKDPVRVTVQGQACTGSQSCEIIAFPQGEVEYTLAESDMKLVKSATAAINKVADFLTGLLSPIGNAEVEMKVLEGVNVVLTCEWLELERDAPRAGLKAYQCNTKLTVQFNIDDIFFISIKLGCPLARVLDFFLPGSGWVVQKICNWFGLKAQAYISVEAGVGIRLTLTLNEYWEGEAPKVSILPKFKVAIGMEIRYRHNIVIDGKAAAKWEPEFNNGQFDKDALIAFDLAEGSVDIGFEGTIYVSFLRFEYNKSGSFYPESWKFHYAKNTLRPLKPVMALIKN